MTDDEQERGVLERKDSKNGESKVRSNKAKDGEQRTAQPKASVWREEKRAGPRAERDSSERGFRKLPDANAFFNIGETDVTSLAR